MKITTVYTRTGDNGQTSIVGGHRLPKSHARLEAYGTVDELSAYLGLLASILPAKEDREQIQRIQHCLFYVCTHLATDQSLNELPASGRLPEGEVEQLEEQIDLLVAELPPLSGFILPGGTVPAAQCHVARTICRRAERRIAALAAEAVVGQDIARYINRLSDFLFVFARKINCSEGEDEKMWRKPCK